MTNLEKYIWLLDTLRRFGPQTLAELSDRWRDNEDLSRGKDLQRCKLNRWRDDILLTFGIEISCDRTKGYKYQIDNPEDLSANIIQKWMIELFSLQSSMIGDCGLYSRVVMDDIAPGCDLITIVVYGMKTSQSLRMTYRGYGKSPSTFIVEPWALRCHANRWYMLGKSEMSDFPMIYALDRMVDLQSSGEDFEKPADFNAKEFFSRYFGVVINDETKPQRIVIRAFEGHANYLRSLPLHSSQEEIAAVDGEYADFRLFLAPTYDFIMALLGMGAMIEVLEPASLRQEIKTWAQEVVDLYH